MKKQLTKLALTVALGLAITFTFTACEEKEKKQDGTKPQETASETATAEANGGTFTDPRDKKTYKTVKIAEQIWMAENLNYEVGGSMCYDNDPANCQTYGRLYDYETAIKACPSGWHLPNTTEWQTLVDFAGGDKNAGKALKATSGWNDNGNGTDKFGFTTLPGGKMECRDGCDFYNVGSSSEWVNVIIYANDRVLIDEPDLPDKGNGASFSVRCIKD